MAYAAAAMAAYGAVQKAKADEYNAQADQNEKQLSVNQGNAAMGLQLMRNRAAAGTQAAAFGAAGGGYGGSAATAMKNSAVNMELDALNTKYRGLVAGYGYGVEAQQKGQAANEDLIGGGLLAGSAMLKQSGYSSEAA